MIGAIDEAKKKAKPEAPTQAKAGPRLSRTAAAR